MRGRNPSGWGGRKDLAVNNTSGFLFAYLRRKEIYHGNETA
jgi:hypothetical protein